MISSAMRVSRARFSFGLRIYNWDEQAEAEVAGEAQRERALHRLSETNLQEAAERVRLREAALVVEATDCSFPLHAGTPQVKFRNLPTVRR